jgi:hypothetical protein
VTIRTRYGGVFFLLNVLLALDVYGDFTRPRTRMVEASPWRLVGHVTRRLLGKALDPDDAVWALLADLAGPSDLGQDTWPDTWRIPPEWLVPFPARDGWTWHTEGGRLRLSHPDGFVVVDVPAQSDLPAQVAREMGSYRPLSPAPGRGTTSDATWDGALALFLRARIHAALGAKDPGASVRMVLERAARVVATDTNVDVHMALADLPVEVRLAGLDRDPGWVPAAGRSVAFHFD